MPHFILKIILLSRQALGTNIGKAALKKREIYALSYSPLAFFDVTPTGGCLNQTVFVRPL
jgi:hypothetical protein